MAHTVANLLAMLSAKEIMTMVSSGWIKLTLLESAKTIHVNLANASTIEGHKKGARIWFLANARDGTIDVSETADEILDQLGEMKSADRT